MTNETCPCSKGVPIFLEAVGWNWPVDVGVKASIQLIKQRLHYEVGSKWRRAPPSRLTPLVNGRLPVQYYHYTGFVDKCSHVFQLGSLVKKYDKLTRGDIADNLDLWAITSINKYSAVVFFQGEYNPTSFLVCSQALGFFLTWIFF